MKLKPRLKGLAEVKAARLEHEAERRRPRYFFDTGTAGNDVISSPTMPWPSGNIRRRYRA